VIPDMVQPSLEEFTAASRNQRVLALRRRLPADLDTPVSAFLKLRAADDPRLHPRFLLESVEQGIQVGRYSFIGVSAAATVTFATGKVTIQRDGGAGLEPTPTGPDGDPSRPERDFPSRIEVVEAGADPLCFLREELERTPLPHDFELPGPFAGAVGYLGWEMAGCFERLPRPGRGGLDLPDYHFVIPRALVVFDHVRSEMEIVVLPPPGDPVASYEQASHLIEGISEALSTPLAHHERTPKEIEAVPPASNLSRSRFEEMVTRARGHILAGDAFQIVLSQRFTGRCSADAFQVYRALRILNPSPYLFFLDGGDFQFVGSSPEALVRLEGRRATVVPIAGTRPRGMGRIEDERLAAELLGDAKERAEHIMLVDLARNDLGRVCTPGSIEVDSLMEVERYSHVMHIVSKVSGELGEGHDAFDLLRAVFPAGTVSGAPKIRAMEIIAELEAEPRGPYAGSIGYFGRDGSMDMCITIRTIVMQGDTCSVQAGAGIVADSDPAREYEETVNKAQALIRAIHIAQERFS